MRCNRALRIYIETDHASQNCEELPRLWRLADYHIQNCILCTKKVMQLEDQIIKEILSNPREENI